MTRPKSILISVLIFLSTFCEVFSDNTCDGGWEPYKNEKCLRAFDTEIETYAEAESFCKQKYDAYLVSINIENKQRFVENFLKSKGIVDEVWIGLKYESDDNYVWSDNSVFQYSNWGAGNPKNDSNYCVQMSLDEAQFGLWADVPCTKRNLVLCEKVQPWSLAQIQNKVMSIEQSLIPLGFIYVQLPKEKSPTEIWPWMTWADVSSDYDSVFFRVVGESSADFGAVQQPSSPRITDAWHTNTFNCSYSIQIYPDDSWSDFIFTAQKSLNAYGSQGIAFRQSGDEVRPRNMAVRVWKRIK